MDAVLEQKLSNAVAFATWLHERTNEIEISIDRRAQIALSILQHSLDIGDAIVCLLHNGLPGPALTLARPLFESYVRGYWLLSKKVSDKAVDNFIEGRHPKKLRKIINELENNVDSGAAWIKNNSKVNLKSFDELTHGGEPHYLRHISEGRIEPTYPDAELESYLDLALEIQMRIGHILLSMANDLDGLGQLGQFASTVRGVSR
ncbi:DUF6988 family protein [Nitrosococcus wardiae]|uniref:AbiV family abortive infection protein n=1 Tax=Nitrosococcus wardiae TaxID=1814290 RepID=A0A4P7BWD0_9GAMM|nr:DUF5677 domain-containing protein [Nitrosococcus wardiae]QBQ53390.1 hypothetical protein E3U44_01860 [Nitrosococcus wardiae]